MPAVDQATRILFFLAEWYEGVGDAQPSICREVELSARARVLPYLARCVEADLGDEERAPPNVSSSARLPRLFSRGPFSSTPISRRSPPIWTIWCRLRAVRLSWGSYTATVLSVWARKEPTQTMGIAVGVGHRFPLTMGAHGKAILAALPPSELERVLAEGSLDLSGEQSRDSVAL